METKFFFVSVGGVYRVYDERCDLYYERCIERLVRYFGIWFLGVNGQPQ